MLLAYGKKENGTHLKVRKISYKDKNTKYKKLI